MKPVKINFPITIPFNCNNLSDKEIDDNFELIEEFFVSKGLSGGPAITPDQLIQKVNNIKDENFPQEPLFWAIISEGQFQVYVGLFTKN